MSSYKDKLEERIYELEQENKELKSKLGDMQALVSLLLKEPLEFLETLAEFSLGKMREIFKPKETEEEEND